MMRYRYYIFPAIVFYGVVLSLDFAFFSLLASFLLRRCSMKREYAVCCEIATPMREDIIGSRPLPSCSCAPLISNR